MEELMKYWTIIHDWAYTRSGVETAWLLWFTQYAIILGWYIVDLLGIILNYLKKIYLDYKK